MPHALNIRDIGENLNAALDARAAEEGLSKSELVRRLLAEAVEPPRRRLGVGRDLLDKDMRTAIGKMRDHPGVESGWRGFAELGTDSLAADREK